MYVYLHACIEACLHVCIQACLVYVHMHAYRHICVVFMPGTRVCVHACKSAGSGGCNSSSVVCVYACTHACVLVRLCE